MMAKSVLGLAAIFVALFAWALSSPAGSAPDDDFHLASAWCGQGERAGLCENVTETSAMVPQRVLHAACFARDKSMNSECQATLTNDMELTNRLNLVERTYPGGYYWVMSWFATPDVSASIVFMRIFNILVFVSALILTLLLTIQRLKPVLILTIFVTVVPLGMFTIASTNPSSWTLFAPVFIFFLITTLREKHQRPWQNIAVIGAIAFVTIGATFARADAAMFCIFAAILPFVSFGGPSRRKIPPYLGLAFVVLIGSFSISQSGQMSAISTGVGDGSSESSNGSLSLLIRNFVDLPSLYVGALGQGNLGWLDTPVPSFVWVFQTALMGALALTAIYFKRHRSELIGPSIGLVVMILIPLYILQKSGAPVGMLVQPRYVLPLMALCVAVLFSTRTRRLSLSNAQINIHVWIVVAANALALLTNTLRYSTGLSTVPTAGSQISAMTLAIVAVGSAAFAGCAYAFLSAPMTSKLWITKP